MKTKNQIASETQTPTSVLLTPVISVTKDQAQQKILKIEAELSVIRNHFKCELSIPTSKIDSLTISLNYDLRNLENYPRKCLSTL